MDDVIQVLVPDPESQFRLRRCKCGSDNVAYCQYLLGRQELWRVRCFDCGFTVDRHRLFRHEAQVAWNEEVAE